MQSSAPKGKLRLTIQELRLTPPPYMREIGTICQIGVFAGKQCIFWAQNRPFSAISHYKNRDALKDSAWATDIENVVRNRRK